MNKVKLYILDTSLFTLDELSSFSFDVDIKDDLLNTQKKKEKVISKYLKDKYIKNYYISKTNKPLSDDICFNISHSGNLIILGMSDIPLGVDIELIRPIKEQLKKYISTSIEYEYIKDEETFFEIWTNKESLLKCQGEGIVTKLDQVPALPINDVRTYLNECYISKTFKFKNYIISITLKGNTPFEVELEEINNIS